MANTYTQLYVQIVFAVQGRQSLIPQRHKEELHKYIAGIVDNKGHKLLAVNGMPDHCHVFIGINPLSSVSSIAGEVKSNSARFINKQGWSHGRFSWQSGYGAFSYHHSQLTRIIQYIRNQEQHHRRSTFKEEYEALLEEFNVKYNSKYVFDYPHDID
ncbi:MAG: transposase [Ectothiorhodospiraceae bacterium]|nr:transposase [Ectothiorhodospiraceae bacterium]